jgi:hypothetical protein
VSRRPLGCLYEIVETLVLTLILFAGVRDGVRDPPHREGVAPVLPLGTFGIVSNPGHPELTSPSP